MEPEALYMNLGHLIARMPDLENADLSGETLAWLGQAYALVEPALGLVDAASIRSSTDTLTLNAGYTGDIERGRRTAASRAIQTILYRALAVAELKAPARVQGTFIPAGGVFDTVAAISRIVGSAQNTVLFVDPYMDERVLTDFAVLVPEGVAVQVLPDAANVQPSLEPAGRRWVAQYNNRPLEIRLAARRSIHDRLIIVDSADVWVLTQSFNAFANRAPATIVKFPDPVIKIQAYEQMWLASALVALT